MHHGPPSISSRRTRFGQLVAPVAEAPSVNFMMLPLWTRVTLLRLLVDGVLNRGANQTLVPSCYTGLMPMPELAGKRIPSRSVPLQKIADLLRFGRAGRVLDSGVDVFRVLAEDHHVHLRVLTGEGTPRNTARAQANIKVEHLTQRHVERADAPPTGVVRGPLMPTRYSLNASTVSSGSHSPAPYTSDFSPA